MVSKRAILMSLYPRIFIETPWIFNQIHWSLEKINNGSLLTFDILQLPVSTFANLPRFFNVNNVSFVPKWNQRESVGIIRNFSEQHARKSGTYFCADKGITSVVIKGSAEHKDTLGDPLSPCRWVYFLVLMDCFSTHGLSSYVWCILLYYSRLMRATDFMMPLLSWQLIWWSSKSIYLCVCN